MEGNRYREESGNPTEESPGQRSHFLNASTRLSGVQNEQWNFRNRRYRGTNSTYPRTSRIMRQNGMRQRGMEGNRYREESGYPTEESPGQRSHFLNASTSPSSVQNEERNSRNSIYRPSHYRGTNSTYPSTSRITQNGIRQRETRNQGRGPRYHPYKNHGGQDLRNKLQGRRHRSGRIARGHYRGRGQCGMDGNVSRPDRVITSMEMANTSHGGSVKKEAHDDQMDARTELLKMVMKNLHPLHLVDKATFRALVKALNPGDPVPCDSSEAQTQLRNMYEIKRSEVKNTLSSAESVVLTVEKWKLQSSETYLTLRCHCIDTVWARKCFVLETTRLMEGHSADSVVAEAASRWGIETKMSVVVSNMADMKDSSQKKWHEIPCFDHILDTTFESAARSVWGDKWHRLLKKCTNIVDFISGSQERAQKFKEQWSGRRRSKLVEFPQRWFMDKKWPVTLSMLEWILDHKTGIDKLLLYETNSELWITPVDMTMIEDAICTLTLFRNPVQELGKGFRPLSEIIPFLVEMHEKITEDSSVLKVELAKKCEKHILNIKQSKWLKFSTILDPRFQLSFADQPESTKDEMVAELMKIGTVGSATRASMPQPEGRSVLERYLEQEPLQRDKNPLEFWRDQKNLSAMAPMAQKYLTVVSTALPLDRAFGPELYKREIMLEPGDIHMMLFLQGNLTQP